MSAAADRLDRFRARLAELQLPAALLSAPESVRYLSGFTGSTALLWVTPSRTVFITDSRYGSQAKAECPRLELSVIQSSAGYLDGALAAGAELGVRLAAVEADALTLASFDEYRSRLTGITLAPVRDLVAPLRQIKDADEIAVMRRACALADRGFEHVLGLLKPGVTERSLAADLDHFLKRNGAEKEAFDTIVASGWRSALPHGRATDKAIAPGDFITFDFGARLEGYNSDLTRTVVLGEATERQREVYGIVHEALEAAKAAMRDGASGTAVDAVARDLIAARGHGEHFGHGLGHGLGRAVHDHPGLSPKFDITLKAGMVITVEPGIYVEGWGGVRIEDDVLVTESGWESLTHAPRELIEVPV
jgi:Xaa-Pro aminopeptidase